jgi:hypothetical protein
VSTQPLDLSRLRVFPLNSRKSLTRVEDILLDPDSTPKKLSDANLQSIRQCAESIRSARQRGAAIMLIYGAHLLRNGAATLLDRLMANGWLSHVATNGAGTIHDWEYAWCGVSTESVEDGVKHGRFGTWDETSLNIHRALMAGSLAAKGYGESLGQFIEEDGTHLPTIEDLTRSIVSEPTHPLTAARADLLRTMREQKWQSGQVAVEHPWKRASILAAAYRHGIPATVHPGIGYDIISNHPVFNGAVIGRAAEWDFKLFGGSVDKLNGGVVLSVGSAIMGPQVFEKSISCVNNIRLQEGRPTVSGHSIYVVDLQDGGNWDWSQGEPPKTNPAYYLRFCKSYSRMGGAMHYLSCDNAAFIQGLYQELVN